MKSLKVLAALAIAAATFSACGNSTLDSLSYAIGLAQSQYVRQAIQQGQVIDTTYMDEFVKGINEGANAGDDKKRAAYIMGLQIGQQIATQLVKGVNHEVYGNDSTKTISLKNLLAGFVTGATGKKGLMTPEMANQVAQTKMEIIKSKTMMKEYGANKVAGEKFLAANKKKPGVPHRHHYRYGQLRRPHHRRQDLRKLIYQRPRPCHHPAQAVYPRLDTGSDPYARWFCLGGLHSSELSLRCS